MKKETFRRKERAGWHASVWIESNSMQWPEKGSLASGAGRRPTIGEERKE